MTNEYMSYAVAAEPWMQAASCASTDPEIFFPQGRHEQKQKSTREAAARAVCHRCPVAADCLQFALRHDVEGMWAATTWLERRAIVRGMSA